VIAPVAASLRLLSVCLIRKVVMTRWMICNTGVSSSGCTANRLRNGKLLERGLATWTNAGYTLEASPQTPPDSYCIDYLFFVHDRHFGNREAMKQYLEWETGLIKQLDEQDKASFKVGEPT
jgi:hypothetical protein